MTARPSDYEKVQALFDRIADLPAGEAEVVARQHCNDEALIAEALELARFDRAPVAARSDGPSKGGRPSATVSILLPGTRVGEYELLEPTSSGATSDVWLGQSAARERVAIKIASPGADASELLAESDLLSESNASELPAYVAHGELTGGQPYLVMEWLDGGPLNAAELLGPRVDPVDVATRCMRALIALHERGYAHGDLKPAHLRLSPDGDVRLLDLGSSSPLGATEATPFTPRWAAPERSAGGPPSARSDVYSLAAILQHAMPWARLDERYGKTARLQSVFASSTSDAPDQRPSSATELLTEWEAALHAAQGIRRRRRAGWVAFAAATCLGVYGLALARESGQRRDLLSTVPSLLASGPKDVEVQRWVESGEPERVLLLSELAHRELDSGSLESAVRWLEAAERSRSADGPVPTTALERLAEGWLRMESPARAMPVLDAITDRPGPSPKTQRLRDAALAQRGDPSGVPMGRPQEGSAVATADRLLEPLREARVDPSSWGTDKNAVFAALDASRAALGPDAPRSVDQDLILARAALQLRDGPGSLRVAETLANRGDQRGHRARSLAWTRARALLLAGETEQAYACLGFSGEESPVDAAITKSLLAVMCPQASRVDAAEAARVALAGLSATTDHAGQLTTSALSQALGSSADPFDLSEATVEALDTLRNLDVPQHVRVARAICAFPESVYPDTSKLGALLDLGADAVVQHAATGSMDDAEFAIWLTQELVQRRVFHPLPRIAQAFGGSDAPWGVDVADVLDGLAPMSKRAPDIGTFATRLGTDAVELCRERIAALPGVDRHVFSDRLLIHFVMRIRRDLGEASAAPWWELMVPDTEE